MKTKIQNALDIVAESRPRMNGYTAEERAELERIGRQRISEGAKAALRQTVYGRSIAKMTEKPNAP